MSNQYQTTIDNQGNLIEGAFPTLQWFNSLYQHIDLKDKIIVDYGAGEGMMSILCKKNRAKRVIGIEHNPRGLFLNPSTYGIEAINGNIEENITHSDVTILSMIIHWIDHTTTREILNATKESVAIIYRHKNDLYQVPENGKWFPTTDELNTFALSCGFRRINEIHLMTQDNGKAINLAVFKRYKNLSIENGYYLKRNIYCDDIWQEKAKILLPLIFPDVIIMPNGYMLPSMIPNPDHKSVRELLIRLESIFTTTGLMIQDVTPSNIMLYKEQAILIDYDEIGDWNPNNINWLKTQQHFT